ncbi:MAG: hypothetical protein ACK4TR_08810 [Phenylobacterium sp.]|uniref:hypothetical protein n=1 Tax=Phenylobacterium sp. TaxID=1871053 RepID=UPI00391D3645
MTKPNGVILWEGPSALDGAPIVVIATGIAAKSGNEKTGDMVQTWIMRQDVAPHHALKTGQDASVCGDCMHRPANGGSCYVKVFQAPLSVWNAYQRGVYPRILPGEARDLFAGRMVRLGSYGDPAAAPYDLWAAIVGRAKGWTGYTHQWRTCDHRFANLLMASADSEAEGVTARAFGWRTFRIRTADEPVAPKAEFVCPASAEAGYRTDCASCRACGGTMAKAKASPVIVAHGATARRFALYRAGQPVTA